MKKYDSKNSNLDEEDKLTVKQLVDGLEKLDQWNPVSTPNLQWFQQNVELEKKEFEKNNGKTSTLLSLLRYLCFQLRVLSFIINQFFFYIFSLWESSYCP